VTLEHVRVHKLAATDLTDVALFRCVRLLVLLQIRGRRELLSTDVAREHLIPGMLQHVVLHSVRPPELFVAYLTLERLGQMYPSVLVEVSLVYKVLAARLADVRPLAGVCTRVHTELGLREKPLLAVAAREVRNVFVTDHMRAPVGRPRKLAAADLARERSLGRVPVFVEIGAEREFLVADVAAERSYAGMGPPVHL